MLGLTKLYPEQENALFHFLSRENVFVKAYDEVREVNFPDCTTCRKWTLQIVYTIWSTLYHCYFSLGCSHEWPRCCSSEVQYRSSFCFFRTRCGGSERIIVAMKDIIHEQNKRYLTLAIERKSSDRRASIIDSREAKAEFFAGTEVIRIN